MKQLPMPSTVMRESIILSISEDIDISQHVSLTDKPVLQESNCGTKTIWDNNMGANIHKIDHMYYGPPKKTSILLVEGIPWFKLLGILYQKRRKRIKYGVNIISSSRGYSHFQMSPLENLDIHKNIKLVLIQYLNGFPFMLPH